MSREIAMQESNHKAQVRMIGFVVLIVIVGILLNVATQGKFLALSNIGLIVTSMVAPSLAAWGINFIFTSGVTDLSFGAIIILAATASGIIGNAFGYVPMVIVGILVGVACVALNYTLFNVTKIPSWIAGLGMAMVYETIGGIYAAYRSAQGLKVESLEANMRAFGKAPLIFVLLAIGFLIAFVIYNYTAIGLNLRATGENKEVSAMMGIKTSRALLMGGIMAGVFFGLAGFAKESYAGYVVAATGLSSLSTVFQPIAAVLLAQALSKYINLIIAIPISTFIISAIFNMLTLIGVPSGTFQEALLGFIVIIFGILAQRKVKGVVK